jgi:hypothetical protein
MLGPLAVILRFHRLAAGGPVVSPAMPMRRWRVPRCMGSRRVRHLVVRASIAA